MSAALLDQVLAGDLEAVRAAVTDLPEADRRRLARSAIGLLREVRDAYNGQAPGKVWPYPGERTPVLQCAEVLVLATVTPSEFRKLGAWRLPSDELALDTLINRL